MQRRELFIHAGRHAAALALAGLFAPPAGSRHTTLERLAAWDDPFHLGVASGMPGPNSVVIWTRLVPRPREPLGGMPDAPVQVTWEVADDEAFSTIVARGEAVALPQHAHSVHVEVTGLRSDRRYFYRFHSADALSPTGRTRTAPAADAPSGRLRLALASCQHYEQGAFAVHREIAERDLDLVLFVGDYIYETNRRDPERPHEGPRPTTLDGYRQRHVTYKLDPHLRASHAAHPWVLTWDDHEVENDYAGTASNDAAVSMAEFLRIRTAAYKAYFEHMPVSPSMLPGPQGMRIHEHYRWGQLADLWTLDTRQYRSTQACNPPGVGGGRVLTRCDELQAEPRSMLGTEQEAWIGQQLAGSDRTWRLLAQSTQIAPGGVATPLGRSIFSDTWDGYPRARERLMRAIAEQPKRNVVCFGGDVHRHVVANLRADPDDLRTPVVATEIVSTSVTSRGLSNAATAVLRSANPDLLHVRGDERGYALIDLTAERLHVDLRATDFPVIEGATLRSQAQYVVENGQPTPQKEA